MPTYTMPANGVLRVIAQLSMTQELMEDPLFARGHVQVREEEAALVEWEQMDTYKGMQQARGYNGAPRTVKMVGSKRWRMEPGVYGEYIPIDEAKLIMRRQLGTHADTINISDLITQADKQLGVRRATLIRYILWRLVSKGEFVIANDDGYVHTDTFPLQNYVAPIAWSNHATATPLADLRAIQLMEIGNGVKFDQGADLFLGRVAINHLLANTNQADLAGRQSRVDSVLTLQGINELLMGEGLPTIVPFDDTYEDENSVHQRYLDSENGALFGRRPAGQVIAEYIMTLNAVTDEAGAYNYVRDMRQEQGPPEIQVHDGHNGGPAILFPSSIVRLTVL